MSSNFINISERAYKYIRQFTIKSVDDAIIELVTNSIDAYNKSDIVNRNIYIDIINPDVIKVRDNAIGLSADGLQKCFLQVGDFTASNESRGFFSRGAKDISALGNIIFRTIKNDLYSECIIDINAYGQIITSDIDASIELRDLCGIKEGNGLEVTIELLPMFQNIDYSFTFQEIQKIAVLRDIVSNLNNFIYVRELSTDGTILSTNRAEYIYPPSKQILDMTFVVPDYLNNIARIVINATDTPISQPIKENQMEFGFLIKDKTSIYEVSVIDSKYRWNPCINYIFGYLECNTIHDFLIDYDINGASIKNPYPIIDPSRTTGVNKQHPFIQKMFEVINPRIDSILRSLNTTSSSNSVSINDVNDIMNELIKYGVNLIGSENITLEYSPSYDIKLAESIENTRNQYVVSEKSNVLNKNNIDNTITNQINQIIHNKNSETLTPYYIKLNDEEIQNISTEFIQNNVVNINSITDKYANSLTNHPYIYEVERDGSIATLYVYSNSNSDSRDINDNNTVEKPKKKVTMPIQQNKFNIEFINDLNMIERYLIEYTNGVNVKINLNNKVVKKYLVGDQILQTSDSSNLDFNNLSSTKTLVFLQELIIDIMVEIITTNAIKTNKLILETSDQFSSYKKMKIYEDYVISNTESTIYNLFNTYIEQNMKNKTNIINEKIDTYHNLASSFVIENAESTNNSLNSLDNIKYMLQNIINNVME